jgi:hypothetical protein
VYVPPLTSDFSPTKRAIPPRFRGCLSLFSPALVLISAASAASNRREFQNAADIEQQLTSIFQSRPCAFLRSASRVNVFEQSFMFSQSLIFSVAFGFANQ